MDLFINPFMTVQCPALWSSGQPVKTSWSLWGSLYFSYYDPQLWPYKFRRFQSLLVSRKMLKNLMRSQSSIVLIVQFSNHLFFVPLVIDKNNEYSAAFVVSQHYFASFCGSKLRNMMRFGMNAPFFVYSRQVLSFARTFHHVRDNCRTDLPSFRLLLCKWQGK